MSDMPLIKSGSLWDEICSNGRPSRKLFVKIVEKKIFDMEAQIKKMKNCFNCSKRILLSNEEDSCLEKILCIDSDRWRLKK
jgi:hypothetical protein